MKRFTACLSVSFLVLALGAGLAAAKDDEKHDQGKHLGQIKNADKGEGRKVGHDKHGKHQKGEEAAPEAERTAQANPAGTPAPKPAQQTPGQPQPAQAAPAAPSGAYALTIGPTAKLKSKGTKKDVSTGELTAGSKVGDIEITPEVAAKLQAALPKSLQVTPDAKNPFKLMVSVDGKPGEAVLYNPKERTFLWGKITKAQSGAGGKCGQIEGASVKGKFTPDFSAIEGGEVNTGFIAGCTPVLVQADVTYTFTGKKQ